MARLPCSTCKADCCGPVILSAGRLAKIEKHIASMEPQERSILASQKRDKITCAFVDTRDYSCSIYPVRPALCDLYGRTDGMKCPHHPTLVNIVSRETAGMRIDLDQDDGEITISTEYNWRI